VGVGWAYDVGLWYEYVRVGMWLIQFDVFCGVVVNGVKAGSASLPRGGGVC
jgi:hypothetical protein